MYPVNHATTASHGPARDREEASMALVTQRIWRSGSRKVKRAAWGYTVQLDGPSPVTV
jgi:hypothetical protein